MSDFPFIRRGPKWLRSGLKFARSLACCCDGDPSKPPSWPGETVSPCPGCLQLIASKRYQITLPGDITNDVCSDCNTIPGTYIVERVFVLGGDCDYDSPLFTPFCTFYNYAMRLSIRPGLLVGQVDIVFFLSIGGGGTTAVWRDTLKLPGEPNVSCNFVNREIPFFEVQSPFGLCNVGGSPVLVSAAP